MKLIAHCVVLVELMRYWCKPETVADCTLPSAIKRLPSFWCRSFCVQAQLPFAVFAQAELLMIT